MFMCAINSHKGRLFTLIFHSLYVVTYKMQRGFCILFHTLYIARFRTLHLYKPVDVTDLQGYTYGLWNCTSTELSDGLCGSVWLYIWTVWAEIREDHTRSENVANLANTNTWQFCINCWGSIRKLTNTTFIFESKMLWTWQIEITDATFEYYP